MATHLPVLSHRAFAPRVCVYHHTCPVPLHKSQLEEFSWAVSRCQSLELGLILFAMQGGGSFPCLGMCKVGWRSPVGTG